MMQQEKEAKKRWMTNQLTATKDGYMQQGTESGKENQGTHNNAVTRNNQQ